MAVSNDMVARLVIAGPQDAGQRIDNYLHKLLKGVPKTRIYRALRKGEVRVNGHRVRPSYPLADNDRVRVPPLRHKTPGKRPAVTEQWLDRLPVLHEDTDLLVLNKPAGLAVHGGSGLEFGLIEALRQLRPESEFLELVHRLDRETSGCLMLARNRLTLVALQRQLADHQGIRKHYLALVGGVLSSRVAVTLNVPLRSVRQPDGRKRMVADPDGQPASTVVRTRQAFADSTLIEAELLTGRMHQARVHLAHLGHPIAGDRLYGDGRLNACMRRRGLGRLFLHAERLRVYHPTRRQTMDFFAPLPDSLTSVLTDL